MLKEFQLPNPKGQVLVQWGESKPVYYGRVGKDATAQEVMDYAVAAVEKCGKGLEAKSAIFKDGNWIVKSADFDWSAWEV